MKAEYPLLTTGKIEPLMRANRTYTPGIVYNFLQVRGFRNTSLLGYPESILQSPLIVDSTGSRKTSLCSTNPMRVWAP
jgi:hypothetical protein